MFLNGGVGIRIYKEETWVNQEVRERNNASKPQPRHPSSSVVYGQINHLCLDEITLGRELWVKAASLIFDVASHASTPHTHIHT